MISQAHSDETEAVGEQGTLNSPAHLDSGDLPLLLKMPYEEQ